MSHNEFFYYFGGEGGRLEAVRNGRWKLRERDGVESFRCGGIIQITAIPLAVPSQPGAPQAASLPPRLRAPA